MRLSTKDQLEGKVHEVKGAVKAIAGVATNNPGLESEGRLEKVAGTVQKTVGKIENLLED